MILVSIYENKKNNFLHSYLIFAIARLQSKSRNNPKVRSIVAKKCMMSLLKNPGNIAGKFANPIEKIYESSVNWISFSRT